MFIQTKYLNTNMNRTDLCIIMTKTVAFAKCHPTLCEPLAVCRTESEKQQQQRVDKDCLCQ